MRFFVFPREDIGNIKEILKTDGLEYFAGNWLKADKLSFIIFTFLSLTIGQFFTF